MLKWACSAPIATSKPMRMVTVNSMAKCATLSRFDARIVTAPSTRRPLSKEPATPARELDLTRDHKGGFQKTGAKQKLTVNGKSKWVEIAQLSDIDDSHSKKYKSAFNLARYAHTIQK